MNVDIMIKAFVVAGSLAIGTASLLWFHMKPHNPVEAVAEYVIQKETGANVDLAALEGLDSSTTTTK